MNKKPRTCATLALVLMLVGCDRKPQQSAAVVQSKGVQAPLAEEQRIVAPQETPAAEVLNAGNAPVAISNAKTSAIETVRGYLSTPSRLERLRFVLNPEVARPAMLSHYGGFSTQIPTNGFEILTTEEPVPTRKGWVTVQVALAERNLLGAAFRGVHSFYLKQTTDGFKIDWERSIGFNRVSPQAFRATKPKAPVRFYCQARLSDYYNYQFSGWKESAWSVELDAVGRVIGHGYARKDTALGQALFETLKDGKKHQLTVELQYPENADAPSVFLIAKLVTVDSWLDIDSETGETKTPEQVAAEAVQRQAEQLRRREEIAKKAAETDQRVLKFQQQKAAEGYGDFQYELALRYLNGKGVETNRALAIRWLRNACTNGEAAASNVLSKLGLSAGTP